jgi:hypothetical protein
MSFDWLKGFQQTREKSDDYADKTLAAYHLGMRANGSIAGVRVEADPHGCEACKRLDSTTIFHPDEAPRLPLPNCDRARSCGCVYRPVMTYELNDQT